ncbi:MAG: hypothetical protein WBV85_02100 [Solirubrobacteraceae bacterium]
MSGIYETVRQAILEKHQVIAAYNGHVREMCPHVIGMKNGRPQALFFQFGGTSSSDSLPGGEWRCIPIEGLQDVVSQAGEWHTAPNHSQPQTCVYVIDVGVAH